MTFEQQALKMTSYGVIRVHKASDEVKHAYYAFPHGLSSLMIFKAQLVDLKAQIVFRLFWCTKRD